MMRRSTTRRRRCCEALYDAAVALLRARCAARGILVEANAHEGFVSKPILPKG